jgi:hypothetical protein
MTADSSERRESVNISRAKFRGTRQLVGNLIAVGSAILLLVVIGVALVVTPPSTGRSGEWRGLAVTLAGLIFMVGLLIRMRSAFSVELDKDKLVYRTLLTTRQIPRSDIKAIGLKDRNRGLAKLSQPYLELRNGDIVWLADMGQGKLIAPNSSMQGELINSVNQWIA